MKCYERDCEEKAGGPWSPYWCPEHDKERVERISASLLQISKSAYLDAMDHDRGTGG